MANSQSLPLTDREIDSVYRNEFYTIDDPRYFEREIVIPKYPNKKGLLYKQAMERKEREKEMTQKNNKIEKMFIWALATKASIICATRESKEELIEKLNSYIPNGIDCPVHIYDINEIIERKTRIEYGSSVIINEGDQILERLLKSLAPINSNNQSDDINVLYMSQTLENIKGKIL